MDTEPTRQKIRLTGAQATLLITLYAKAFDSRSRRSVLNDAMADKIVGAVDYDFSKFKSLEGDRLTVVRAAHYDEWVRKFLTEHSDAVIVYLGCGLDTRITRINPPASTDWFDVDYPDVIELRKNFFSERKGYSMIASSVTDPLWLARIPEGRPTMIIGEGCFEYLTPDEVGKLLNRLTDRFVRGWIAFDVLSSYAVEMGRKQLAETTGAAHTWAVDDARDVDALDPKIRRIETVPVFTSRFVKKLPFGSRLFYGAISLIPKARNALRILLYEF